MKHLLTFLGLLLAFSVSSRSLTVSVIEGWKSTPVPNCRVVLKSNVGEFLEARTTDSLGNVVFSNLTYGYHTVEVDSVGTDFLGDSFRFKLKETHQIVVLLQPTRSYQQFQRSLEDERYGPMSNPKKTDTTQALQGDEEDRNGINDSDTTEVWASYPGGNAVMKSFIKENLVYPELSQELGDQGRVYVQFIIQTDGVITHVSVPRGISPELDNEAMRLVRSMPKWNPGMVNGRTVRTRCRLPLTFTLD